MEPLSVRELEELRSEARRLAEEAGLDPWEVTFGVVDYDRLNELSAYDGFPTRFPHWQFGMSYDYFRKRGAYSGWWTYELVLNTRPAIAYLRESNTAVETKGVMVHVYAHVDFFKNNRWFSKTNRDMIKVMRGHAEQIEHYMNQYGVEKVESFIDKVLSVQYNIDPHAPFIKRRWQEKRPQEEPEDVGRLPVKRDYMERFLNPPEWIEERRARLREQKERKKLRDASELERPQKDLLKFLMRFGRLEEWQKDIIAMIREESYYFVPQIQTKVMNEGWACVVSGTPVFTDQGILPIEEIVEQRLPVRVSDGEAFRPVYDYAAFSKREIVRVRTRRGFELAGSLTHRVLLADGTWKRLDELRVGDMVRLGAGLGHWPDEYVPIDWKPIERFTLQEAARQAGVSLDTLLRYRQGLRIRKHIEVATALAQYEAQGATVLASSPRMRQTICVPKVLNEQLALFLGYLVGDGHLSRVKRQIGFTTGDIEQAKRFRELGERLFGLEAKIRRDGGRWRVLFHSLHLLDFLEWLGLPSGPSASHKQFPPLILRSPKSVVAAFLRAYFDCDAYAGKQGVILSTASESLAKMIQVVLLNFGILSRRRRQSDGCWHVDLMGQPAKVFYEEIGFGLSRKQESLRTYLEDHYFFKPEVLDDEIVSIEHDWAPVYDVSVVGTHRYAAAGFINHNSYWESKIMAEFAGPNEFLDHADMMSKVLGGGGALNPYRLGKLIWEDIKERWDKGRFGREWELCKDREKREKWDTGAGLGDEKIFEVRCNYNDVTFIDEFFTEELFGKLNLFTYEYIPETGAYHITSRDFEDVKKKLLLQYTNLGKPTIKVATGNYDNKGELLLIHEWNGISLHWEEAKRVLKNLYAMWGRPVNLKTIIMRKVKDPDPTRNRIHPERPLTAIMEPQGVLLRYDGETFRELALSPEEVEDIRMDEVDYHTTPKEWIG
jgi:stage V sporulation protein R